MHRDSEPQSPEFAEKRKTRLLIHRAATPKPNDQSLSYFGGLPRLPPDLPWPIVPRRAEDGDGEGDIAPTLIGQIDLSDLPSWPGRQSLPRLGTIYVFCNTQFVGVGDPHCRVFFHPGSSAGFAEGKAPPGLMRIGGSYDDRERFWLRDGDPAAGVDFKYVMRFEASDSTLTKTEREPEAWKEPDLPDWMRFCRHPRLLQNWPQTWIFLQTFREALIAHCERAKLKYSGDPWPGYSHLMDLVRGLPDYAGEHFLWLSEAERKAVREALPTFLNEYKARSKGASHIFSSTARNLISETAYYCTALGFGNGAFDETSDAGRLLAGMEEAAAFGQNQIMGAGITVQSAPYDHSDKILLLQICGDDFAVNGCALQIWASAEEVKAGNFENAFATLESD